MPVHFQGQACLRDIQLGFCMLCASDGAQLSCSVREQRVALLWFKFVSSAPLWQFVWYFCCCFRHGRSHTAPLEFPRKYENPTLSCSAVLFRWFTHAAREHFRRKLKSGVVFTTSHKYFHRFALQECACLVSFNLSSDYQVRAKDNEISCRLLKQYSFCLNRGCMSKQQPVLSNSQAIFFDPASATHVLRGHDYRISCHFWLLISKPVQGA